MQGARLLERETRCRIVEEIGRLNPRPPDMILLVAFSLNIDVGDPLSRMGFWLEQ